MRHETLAMLFILPLGATAGGCATGHAGGHAEVDSTRPLLPASRSAPAHTGSPSAAAHTGSPLTPLPAPAPPTALSSTTKAAATAATPPATLPPTAADAAPLNDEPPYPPGRRPHPPGPVATSQEDAIVASWNHGGWGRSLPTVTGPHGTQHPLHAAPRIKIDLERRGGNIAPEADWLEKQLRSKGYWPVRLCYEGGLRRAQTLRGSFQLRLEVDDKGKVLHAEPSAKAFADGDVVECVAHAASRWTIDLSSHRKAVQPTVAIEVYPGDEPVYVRSGAARTLSDDRADSPLRSSLRALWPRFRSCYAEGAARQHDLWGRLALELVVDATGLVTDATETESHFPDGGVTRCVCDAIRGAHLDSVDAPTRIVYAMRFGSFPDLKQYSSAGPTAEQIPQSPPAHPYSGRRQR